MRLRLKTCLLAGLIMLVGVFVPAISLAGTGIWTTNGPDGGSILSLAASPNYSADHTIFAGTSRGVFKSTDAGSSWSEVSSGLINPYYMEVRSLAISPNFASDQTLFAGVGDDGVFKSTDGGANWSRVDNRLMSMGSDSLAISPNFATDHTIFAGCLNGGVFKSVDAGSTWSEVNTGLTSTIVSSLVISPNFTTDHTLFAGTWFDSGVFKSVDAGSTWSEVNTGLTSTIVSSLVISPNFTTDHTLFASTYDGVFKSTDAGSSWGVANNGLAYGTDIRSFVISPDFASDHTLYAGGSGVPDYYEGGVYKSTDAGASWSAVNTSRYVISMAISPNFTSDHTLFAGTYDDVMKSTDAGTNWSEVNTGLSSLGVSSMAVSPGFATDHTLFAGTFDDIFKSTDAGASWSAVNTGLTDTNVNSLAISPNFATDSTLFAGTSGGGVFKSTNGGANWSAVNTGLTNTNVRSLALSPNFASDSTLFAGTYGGVFKSTDAGSSWAVVNTGLTGTDLKSLAISPNFATDQTLFAGTWNGGVFKSADAGSSWSAVNTGLTDTNVNSLAISPNFATDHTLLASSLNGGVSKSTDAGSSWNAVNNGLDVHTTVNFLAVSPNFATDQTLFAGTWNGGVFKSADAGSSWSAINAGLTSTGVSSLAPSPNFATDHTLFAGTDNAGAFSYTMVPPRNYFWTWYDNRGGDNWVLMSNPAGATEDLGFEISVAGDSQSLFTFNYGVVAPGSTIAPRFGGGFAGILGGMKKDAPGSSIASSFDGGTGGPVSVGSQTGQPGIVSQRILWPKGGNSLEEVLGTEESKLSDHFLWSWYDESAGSGFKNWILIANPSATDTVYYRIKIAGVSPADGPLGQATGSIAPGQNVTPRFPGIMNGPVEVQAWSDSIDGLITADVMASQRVLSNGDSAFNEVPGNPEAELANDYLWTWYDDIGGSNWLLVANPNATPLYYQIEVGKDGCSASPPAGTACAQDNGTPIAPGQNVTPRLGVINGPVQVKTYCDAAHTDTTLSCSKAIASQRTLWGPSFEEVPGYPAGSLSANYHWTWYDQSGAGVSNWVLVANPASATDDITVEVWIGGVRIHEDNNPAKPDSWTLSPGEKATPKFGAYMGGPVEVRAYLATGCWDCNSGADNRQVMASQRVLWQGYFNEVLGTVLE